MRLTAGVGYPPRAERPITREAMHGRPAGARPRRDGRAAGRALPHRTGAALSPEEEYRIPHPEDYVMEMPRSGERFRGQENMRAFQEDFPDHSTPPSIRIRRVLVRDGRWAVESVIDYGEGRVSYGVAILELKDGKVWRDRCYFAERFEAPGWRAHLV